jgi:hypothetical protein
MWIKSQLNDAGVELLWQVRTRLVGDKIIVYDANGGVDYEMDRSKAVYPDSFKSAGVIPIDDHFVEICEDDRYDDALYAIMRHASHMLAEGYGDEPEDIVRLLSDIKSADFMNGVIYKFEKGIFPFEDLDGLIGEISIDDNDFVKLKIRSTGEEYEIQISDKNLIPFIISTVPV